MSLLSNANITRYGIISSWSSNWVESNVLYTSIIYTDIYINELINGIYYKLKMPNSLPTIKNIGYQKTLIYVSSFIYNKERRLFKWPNYYRDLFYVKHLKRRMLFNINRICKHMLYYNNIFTYSIKLFIICPNISLKKSILFINKKNFNIFKKINNIKIKYYKNIYFFKNKKISEYKNKLFRNYIKNNKKNNIINNIKINYIENNNINNDNNYNYTNVTNNINKKDYSTNKYKYDINRSKLSFIIKYKNKINNMYNNKINTYHNINRIKTKIKNIDILRLKNFNLFYNKINYIVYNLLICKINIIYIYIYIYIMLNIMINLYIINNIKKIYFFNIINNIKKINSISNINININIIFNNKLIQNVDNINIIKKNKKYSRVRSQYRLKKKTERLNKEKRYNMYRRIILYHHYFGFVCDTPKYITKVNKELIYKQLCFKINDTINQYLNNSIYYIHNYNDEYFNRIDNPKLLVDLIKILMKYEEKNPTILKKIVKIHSQQNNKSKIFSRKYIRRSHIFMKKINNKLKIQNNSNYLYNKKIINMQKIEIQSTLKHNKYIKNKINNNFIYKSKYCSNNLYDYNEIKKLNLNKINNKKKIKIYTINNNINLLYNKLIYSQYLYKWLSNIKLLKYKKYPLIGMRIELSGPTKKGRRTQTHLYNEWVDFYTLPGKMQLVKIINDIKYWQSYGLTQRASIGIKVWMHFHTIRYSKLRKNIIE